VKQILNEHYPTSCLLKTFGTNFCRKISQEDWKFSREYIGGK